MRAAAVIVRPAPRELVLAGAGLLLLAGLVYGPQIAHGGFLWDDWQNAANVHFVRDPGLLGALSQATERPVFGYRPVLTALLVFEYHTLGLHQHVLIGAAAAFGASTAWALYLVLRTLGLRAREAIVPAALLLLFPWCDSTRMWSTASFDTLAVTLFLLGLALTLRAFCAPSRRRRVLLTCASLALYVLAAWTYEIVTVAILVAGAVYLLAAPRRDVLRRVALDVALVAVALAVVVSGTTRVPVPFGDQITHAGTIAEQSLSLLTRALVPALDLPGVVGALVAVAVVGAALRARRPDLRRWLTAAGLGALGVAAGYVLFVPAAAYYQPLAPGTTNRMNVLAAVGFVVLAYALVRLACALVGGRPARVLAALLPVLIAAGYLDRVIADEAGWHHSAEAQASVLRALRTTLPHPPPGSRIYTFGAPGYVAPGIPAFSLSFDLLAAVRLQYDDLSLHAYPIRGRDVIRCDARGLQPVGGTYSRVHAALYGRAYFVSVPDRRAVRVDSAAQCRELRARLGAAHT